MLATRARDGFWRVKPVGSWLIVMGLLGVLAAGVGEARAQQPRAAADAQAQDPDDLDLDEALPVQPDTFEDDAEEQGVVDPDLIQRIDPVEMYRDPRAVAALENTFRQLSPVRISPTEVRTVESMAEGNARFDAGLVQRYVDAQAADLTDHRNIAALIDRNFPAPPTHSIYRAIETAAMNLMQPLQIALNNNNDQFQRRYTEALLQRLPELLENHLFARIQAMEVLSMTGERDVLPVLIEQLNDPDQVLMVKLLAARGVTTIVQGGRRDLDPQSAIQASQAIATFLREEDAFWPAQVRGLEALGALRQVSFNLLEGKVEPAETALDFLSDPDGHPDTRAWAAWALGMMRVSGQIRDYNFALPAYFMGVVAADLGERIAEAATENMDQAARLTGLLVHRVYRGLDGEPGVNESGLLHVPGAHPNIAAHRTYMTQVAQRVRAVGASAVELIRAAGRQIPQRQANLQRRVAELRSFLTETAPPNNRLVPQGKEYAIDYPQVAGVPARRP